MSLTLLTLLPLACDPAQAEPEPAGSALPVAIVEAQPQDHYVTTRRFTGVVRSQRDARLGFERGGLVADVRVEDGAVVKRGQILARLDVRSLAAERRRLVAQLAEAEAGVGIASLTSGRLDRLAAEQFASAQRRDEAAFQLEAAQAQREQLRAAVASIDVQLDKSVLRAPFGGTVSSRLVDEGTVVGAGTPVVRFLDEVAREAVIGIPAPIASELPVGSPAELEVGEAVLAAHVVAHVRDVDPRTRTVDVIVALPEEARPADGAVVRLRHPRKVSQPGLWLPRAALTEGIRGMFSVYAIEGERAQRHDVEVLHVERERVFVRASLEAGTRVIESGTHRVVVGQRVAEVSEASP